MERSGYQVSDLEDVKFYWENYQLHLDAVFRPGIDSPFSPTTFDDLELGGLAENIILFGEKEDIENFSPTTPVSERLTRPPALMTIQLFGTRTGNVPDSVQ